MNSTEKNKTYPQMEQPMAVRESCEKRKITSIDGEKLPHFGKNSQKISREEKSRLLNLASQTGLVCYVKALLEASSTLPNVIKILDSIIEQRASSFITPASIYGQSCSTLDEVNKVIDLTSRKDKLLNLYLMSKKLLECLDENDKQLVIYKFVKKLSTKDILAELGMAERTFFRSVNRAIDKLAVYMLQCGWDVNFVKRQIGNEPWIIDLAKKKMEEEGANHIRSTKNQKPKSR